MDLSVFINWFENSPAKERMVRGHSALLGKTRMGKFKISKNNSHRETPIVAILYALITPPEKPELQAGH